MKLGILGGGQLGRMLLQEASAFPLIPYVLDPNPQAPCRPFCQHFFTGSLLDKQNVLDFGRQVDLITYEIEHVNIPALKLLQAEGKKIFPDPSTLEIIQDKGLQKLFFQKNNFPTANFRLVEENHDYSQEHFPCIQKRRTGGYDGKGVKLLSSASETPLTGASLLEEKVSIEKEVSLLIARNSSAEVAAYPLVEMIFDPTHHILSHLFSPASLTPKLTQACLELGVRLIHSLNYQGLLTVEFFITQDNKILINELAPRPHNSGHHTIEAALTSQYAQHLRALLDLPLGPTTSYPSAMLNLIGATYSEEKKQHVLRNFACFWHDYGKTLRPGRKMGHLTVVGPETSVVNNEIVQIQKLLQG